MKARFDGGKLGAMVVTVQSSKLLVRRPPGPPMHGGAIGGFYGHPGKGRGHHHSSPDRVRVHHININMTVLIEQTTCYDRRQGSSARLRIAPGKKKKDDDNEERPAGPRRERL